MKSKKAPDNSKAIDYYVTTLIGALLIGSIDTEVNAHDSTVKWPTSAPHLDRKPLIIIAPGEATNEDGLKLEKTEPKASGKETSELGRWAAHVKDVKNVDDDDVDNVNGNDGGNVGDGNGNGVKKEAAEERISFLPAKGELGDY